MESEGVVVARPAGASFLWYWMPVLVYASTIFFLSAQSHPEEQLPDFIFLEFSDKLLHAVEYAVFAVLCLRAARAAGGPRLARHAILFAIVAASLYGLTDELHQSFVPPREASGWDWLADTVGAVIGAAGGSRFSARANQREA